MESGELVLVADIGGTNARFAIANGRQLFDTTVWPTLDHENLSAALEAFLVGAGRPRLAGAAVCAAGPSSRKSGDAVISLSNCPWRVAATDIVKATGVEKPLLLNDFAAIAMAIPVLQSEDVEQIGGDDRDITSPAVVLGPGTGLGVAGLVPTAEGKHVAVATEGGHVDLAPSSDREIAVLRALMARYEHVSAERVLSGPGLVALCEAVCAADGKDLPGGLDAGTIAARASAGSCPVCSEAVRLFCGWLGAVAGDLALSYGAMGGVYLAGGILRRWGGLFDRQLFRHRLEAKGRFDAYLHPVPAYLIETEEPALIGLAMAAQGAV